MGRRIKRNRRGVVTVSLEEHEVDILRDLIDQLRTLLLSGTEPSLRRLFPTAYPDDQKLEAEYQQLVHNNLLESRLQTLDDFETSLGSGQLTTAQLESWMGAVNHLRLVLGTLLDVSEDDVVFDPDAENAFSHAVYHFLGLLLEEIVDVLFSTLDSASG